MSAEGAALGKRCMQCPNYGLHLFLCRTFGAHFYPIRYPDLTVGPIAFRPFGPRRVSFETVSPAGTYSVRPQ